VLAHKNKQSNHIHNLVGWLEDQRPLQHKNMIYQGQGLGWRFSSFRL